MNSGGKVLKKVSLFSIMLRDCLPTPPNLMRGCFLGEDTTSSSAGTPSFYKKLERSLSMA
jgi:hypothetical protein